MPKPIFYSFYGNHALLQSLVSAFDGTIGTLRTRKFPDGETYLQLADDVNKYVENQQAVIVCGLDDPDNKLLALWFLCQTLRDEGAASIGLVIPYLPYMRQDCQFKAGESVTSRHFAKLLSQMGDWLVTVDPHLHRYRKLDEIYSIPCKVLHATSALVAWIEHQPFMPLLIGPDSESEQWVADVASCTNSPYVIADKTRVGDREVAIALPNIQQYSNHTPVIIDDIISSGQTLIKVVQAVKQTNTHRIYCVAIHGILADRAGEKLSELGATIIVSNSIEKKAIETKAIEKKAIAKNRVEESSTGESCLDLSALIVAGVASHLV